MRLLPKDRDHRHLGWTPYAWLVYSTPFLMNTFEVRKTSFEMFVANLVAYLAFLILYFLGYWVHGRKLVAVLGAMTLLGFVTTPYNPFGASLFIYAAAMIAFIDRARPRLLHLGIYLAIVASYGFLTDQKVWFFVPATLFAAIIGG